MSTVKVILKEVKKEKSREFFDKLYKKRRSNYLNLDKLDKKILIFNDFQGTGKTYQALKIAYENSYYTIIFLNDHDLSMEFIKACRDELWAFNNDYLMSRVRKITNKQKEIIETILTGFKFKSEYACSLCADKDFRRVFSYGYMPSDYCHSCSKRRECLYLTLKKQAFRKDLSDPKMPNRFIFLVKSYIKTDIVQSLFKTFPDAQIILDENFISLLFDIVSFDTSLIHHYVYFMNDKVIPLDPFLEPIWLKIEKTFRAISSFKYTPSGKKKVIFKTLIDIVDSFTEEELEEWHENIKNIVTNNRIRLGDIAPDIYNGLELILKDIYNLTHIGAALNRIAIDVKDLSFSYIIDTRETVIELFNNAQKVIISSSTVSKKFFEAVLPEFKDKYILLKDPKIKPKFKEVFMYTSGAYKKYNLYHPIKHTFTSTYRRLLNLLKDIMIKHKYQKLMIVTYKVIEDQLRVDLEELIKKNNIDVIFCHWYNLEGKNKYKLIDVQIQFGSPGITSKTIEIISEILKVKKKRVNKLYIEDEQIQSAERLRSINYPNQKIVYQLSNILNQYYPSVITFKKISQLYYKKFLDALLLNGKSDIDECLKLYNSCGYTKIAKSWMYKLMIELRKDGVVKEIIKRSGPKGGRPKSLYYYS